MNRIRLALVSTPLACAAMVGCIRLPVGPHGQAPGAGADDARAAMGPSHPPTTAAQWTAAEAGARAEAQRLGAQSLRPPTHVVLADNPPGWPNISVRRELPLEAGTCYELGIGWAFPRGATATLTLGDTNPQLGVVQKKLDAPAGGLAFCADVTGTAFIEVGAVVEGRMAVGELLEYAFVLGTRKESPIEAAARHEREGADKQARDVKIAAHQAAYDERVKAKLANLCKKCDAQYHLCQNGNAATGRFERSSSTKCDEQFAYCAHGNSNGDLQLHPERKPCGDPPR